MPQYQVIVTNQSDTANLERPIGSFYVETCEAPDQATVEAMIQRDLARLVNISNYTWTITETAP